jgi:tRNA1(Val) A37 N6-methylase TrmN6
MTTMAAEAFEVSEDAALGGRLILRQPRRGHRFGHDSILLAAAVAAKAGESAIDLGAGVGAAGLALARRVEGLGVTLVEVDPALTALARQNIERNGLSARARAICLDVAAHPAAFEAAGLKPHSAAHVLMNPPFNAPDNPSPERGRHLARVAAPGTLAQWLRAAAGLLHSAGEVTLIWRADGLSAALAAIAEGFGAPAVLPILPKPQQRAIRVIVRAVKGKSAGPPVLLPALVLADANGKPTPQAEAILREARDLPMAAD